MLAGAVGIACNVLLCIFKFIVGTLSGSVSITADAANNLSDAGSNIVTIVGSYISGKPRDKEHPFGHGRMEYLSALFVSVLILMMSFELGKSSIQRMISPQELQFQGVYVIVLSGSIAVKLFMAFFNGYLYKKTGNLSLKAVRQDSLNDCLATGATLAALLISRFTGAFWIDGIIGLMVSVLVFFAGVGIFREILGPLLGQPPSEELVRQIEETMLKEPHIVGIHDMIVHDYGPGNIIASAHAEMPANIDVMQLHDAVDRVEQEIRRELNIEICIHLDPVLTDDEDTFQYKTLTAEVIREYNPEYNFHDFRYLPTETESRLFFDLVIPFGEKLPNQVISDEIQARLQSRDPRIVPFIHIEHAFT